MDTTANRPAAWSLPGRITPLSGFHSRDTLRAREQSFRSEVMGMPSSAPADKAATESSNDRLA
jgi:hypothetical protein